MEIPTAVFIRIDSCCRSSYDSFFYKIVLCYAQNSFYCLLRNDMFYDCKSKNCIINRGLTLNCTKYVFQIPRKYQMFVTLKISKNFPIRHPLKTVSITLPSKKRKCSLLKSKLRSKQCSRI